MSEPSNRPPAEDQLFNAAAGWFARMRGPDAEVSRAEFGEWLEQGPLHRAAYNRAAEVFAMGKLLDEEEQSVTNAKQRSRRSKLPVPAALVALMLVGGATWLGLATIDPRRPDRGSPTETAQLTTGFDEIRRVRLSDGSTLTLAAGTHLSAAFDGGGRRLFLKRGSALFEVARQHRPFIVFAGGGSVTARGTAFNVGLSAEGKVSVRLIEGVVDVALPGRGQNPAPRVRRLRPGDNVSFAVQRQPHAAGGSPAFPSARPLSQLSEAQASEFNDIRLADLASKANRQSARPIRFAQADLGDLRLSGRFRTEDPELLAERIALLFDLAVDRSDPAALVLRRK